VLQAILSSALVALIVIDARHQILPNAITLPGILFGLLTSPLRADTASHPVRNALLGSILGYAIPWTINACYLLWQKGALCAEGASRRTASGRGTSSSWR